MIDLKLEYPFSDGSTYQDILIKNKDVVLISEEEELTQHLGIKLRFINGEWAFDVSKGVRYFGFIFEKGISKNDIDSEFRSVVLSTDDVIEISRFSSNIENRVYALSIDIKTVYGDVTLQENIELGV